MWKDIKNYEGFYQINELGEIKTISTNFRNVKPGKISKGRPSKNGYFSVSLTKNKTVKNFYVHRLVAQAFLGDCPVRCEVNHKDGVRSNNHLDNLEYVTRSENNFHSYRVLSRVPVLTYGVKHHAAKLNPQKAQEIRDAYSQGNETFASLGRSYGVHWTSVRSIILGETWVIR